MQSNQSWKQGTEKYLGAYPSENDPNTIHVQLTAEDNDGNTVHLKKEVDAREFAESFTRDDRCKVVGTIPFQISEQKTKQLRRAS